MKILSLFAGAALAVSSMAMRAGEPSLEEVASFPTQQVTGVTVSAKGRVFVNFPDWSDDHTTSVAEIIKGKPKPYPDEAWNAKDGPAGKRWVCVQSVVVDDQDFLWVLDPASPKTEAVVPGGPKLVKIDLKSDQVVQIIPFSDKIAPERSYLNDVRIDTKSGHAFMTESGTGAIIVVDLKSGQARRLLADSATTKLEPDASVTVDGMKILDPKTQLAPGFQADGIALDRTGGWLYYHALTGTQLYRVKTGDLLNESLTARQLESKVQKLGPTPKPDGMLESDGAAVYLTAIEENAIVRYDPQSKKLTMVVKDEKLQWPDTMAWGPDGQLYVTCSQIHRMPKYHGGESKQKGPYMLYRLKVAQNGD